ncbi:MAG TPA: DUF664 domain-containing protein, partial [Saprospiraceae bacterium]|nr:DUF664 domain-containing protein [Saprospiraceae bacterium]
MPNATQIHTALIHEVEHRLFDESLTRILECLEKLTDEQIWWRPNESSNSIGNLVLHLCGNVRQWIGTGLGNLPDTRKRQTEFDERRQIERDVLVSELVSTMSMAKSVISNLPENELLTSRPVQTFKETGMSILI